MTKVKQLPSIRIFIDKYKDAHEPIILNNITEATLTMMRTDTDISSLDLELLALSFTFLDSEDIASVSLVCRQWHEATQNHILKKEVKVLYLTMIIDKTPAINSYKAFEQNDLENAIKANQLKWYIGSEAETREAAHEYIMPRLEYEDSNTLSGRQYFMAHCHLEGNKLSVLSCELLDYKGNVNRSFQFTSPIICDRRRIDVGACVYDGFSPEFSQKKAEFLEWDNLFQSRARKQHQVNNTKLATPNDAAPIVHKDKSTKLPSQPHSFSQNSATSFAKPKPAPRRPETNTSQSINRKPAGLNAQQSGSCSIS